MTTFLAAIQTDGHNFEGHHLLTSSISTSFNVAVKVQIKETAYLHDLEVDKTNFRPDPEDSKIFTNKV
jgi:hypothetical protein